LILRIEASDNVGRERSSTLNTAACIAASLLLLALSVPPLRLLVRRARQRSLHARIQRRLGARVGSVAARRPPALLPERFRS